MDKQHSIFSLRWENQAAGSEEQRRQADWLSDFSRRGLTRVLEDCFDACCPPAATWRAERLEVDLGSFTEAEFPTELPRRLVHALRDALLRQFASSSPPSQAPEESNEEADEDDESDASPAQSPTPGDLELLAHLLRHGSQPWWLSSFPSLAQVWERLLETLPQALAELLIQLGGDEAVRERLVRQLGRRRMPSLVRLLQPLHADSLIEWVQELTARHVEERLAQDDAGSFEDSAWLALLTCLLVDRGSQFNSIEFAGAHLRRLANRYNLPFEAVLTRLRDISEAKAVRLPQRFLGLVRAVCERHLPRPTVPPPATPGLDLWSRWPEMLARGERRLSPQEGGQSLQHLFLQLADQDARRTAGLLVAAGSPAAPHLVALFSEPALRRVVTLLQPEEAAFILTHVAESRRLAEHRSWPRRAVWLVVLAFLLSEGASRFERRQLVERTLRQLCQRHNLGFVRALDHLIEGARQAAPDPRLYALLRILLSLRQAEAGPLPQPAAKPDQPASERQDKRRILDPQAIPPAEIPAALLWRALRWRLRGGRRAPGMPAALAALPLEIYWQRLPAAALRRWLLRQPDRERLLPQLAALPEPRRWLLRLTPRSLRHLPQGLEQALSWLPPSLDRARLRLLLQAGLWRLLLAPRAASVTAPELLAHLLLDCAASLGIAVADCAQSLETQATDPDWRAAGRRLAAWAAGAPVTLAPLPGNRPTRNRPGPHPQPDAWGSWLRQPDHQQALLRLLCQSAAPSLHLRHGVGRWPGRPSEAAPRHEAEARLSAALIQLAWKDPDGLRRLLRQPWRRASLRPRLEARLRPRLEARLRKALSLPQLIELLGRSAAAPPDLTKLAAAWQSWQERLALPHTQQRRDWLWRQLWQAWLSEDWRRLEPRRLLAAFRQDILPISGLSADALARRLIEQTLASPLTEAQKAELLPHPAPIPAPIPAPTKQPQASKPTHPHPASTERLHLMIRNAGLVLVNSYAPLLFSRLGLLRDQQFTDTAAAEKAALCLQFLACGQSTAVEADLPLNKLLCGLEQAHPMPLQVTLGHDEADLMEGLLRSICGQWPEGGSGSIDGFRGNWLLRNGILSQEGDHLDLKVERKPWDVLLTRFPFSYSVVKLPWMAKPLYVHW